METFEAVCMLIFLVAGLVAIVVGSSSVDKQNNEDLHSYIGQASVRIKLIILGAVAVLSYGLYTAESKIDKVLESVNPPVVNEVQTDESQ